MDDALDTAAQLVDAFLSTDDDDTDDTTAGFSSTYSASTESDPLATSPLLRRLFEQTMAAETAQAERRGFVLRTTWHLRNQPPSSAGNPDHLRRAAFPKGKKPQKILWATVIDPGGAGPYGPILELLPTLPPTIDAILFLPENECAVGYTRPELEQIAAAVAISRLEEAIVAPAPGQRELLLSATWYLPSGKGKLQRQKENNGTELLWVFTNPAQLYSDESPGVALDGRTLFTQLARRDDIDGIAINPHGAVARRNHVVWLPTYCAALLAGDDPRPGAAPLPARTAAEVAFWHELQGFLTASCRVETLYGSKPDQPDTAFPSFTVADPDDTTTFGPGATQILCAGLLAQAVVYKGYGLPKPWAPLSIRDRQLAARVLAWTEQLLALLPAGAVELPLSTARTVRGRAYLRQNPDYRQRAWLEQTQRAWQDVARGRFCRRF